VNLSVGGRLCRRSRRTSTASSRARTGCPTGATCCLQMCGLLTDEERAVKERHGSVLDHEARHDRLCLLRLSREFNAELEIKTHSHLHDQNQKPDIWLIDKCKTIDGASPCHIRWTATATRSSRSQGRDP
ncbi:Chromosome segregation ATPase, partial [Giardia duodenalis]